MKGLRIAVVLIVLAASWFWAQERDSQRAPSSNVPADTRAGRADSPPTLSPSRDAPSDRPGSLPDFLPPEAQDTLDLIARGGPFPHRQDGAVFQNRERRLPAQARGYYREYTVRTPGERTRGARRIVIGGDPPSQYWYTDDHYASFRRFEVER